MQTKCLDKSVAHEIIKKVIGHDRFFRLHSSGIQPKWTFQVSEKSSLKFQYLVYIGPTSIQIITGLVFECMSFNLADPDSINNCRKYLELIDGQTNR